MRFQQVPVYMQWALLASAAAGVPYQEYILAPTTRVLSPVSIYQIGGDVQNAAALLTPSEAGAQCNGSTTFSGNGSYVTLDFGKNIAGGVSFHVDAVSGLNESIGFTFSESSMYVSAQHCDAVQEGAFDLPQWFNNTTPGHYEAGHEFQRGAFRYLTVVHNSTESISLSNVTVYWAASPEMANPAAYTGYFHSDNEKLNRVWYAGAYTNQICSADPTTGVSLGAPFAGWYYNYTVSNGSSVLLDGGKRDRVVWPGDIVISGPSIFVSTNSLEPIRNAIDSLFLYQESDGRLPYAGNPLAQLFPWSFTYHCHTLNDFYDYFMFSGDIDYLASLWEQYKLGMNYPLQFIDSSGLANITTITLSDWGRGGMSGHNIEANSILFYTLKNALELAAIMNDTSESSSWERSAAGIPTAANNLLWDDSVSLYRDNDTITKGSSATSYPQDGNSWAVISGIANGIRAVAVSDALKARWIRPYGAPAVEANDGDTISPFATGFELRAHFMAGHSDYALDLMEFMWADYMLDNPNMTNSTFIEGFGHDGTPLYPVYNNDPRVSHAHGWSTAPTSMLTFFAGGLTMTSAAGKTWKVSPALGGLKTVEASYKTPLGSFAVSWTNNACGLSGTFEVPNSTTGEINIPIAIGSKKMILEGPEGVQEIQLDGSATANVQGLGGGRYTVTVG
ncbi:alpha-L-rhamnosidase [Xylaria sp. FL1042]|nr:alpha-L-rhamnosidase [Xylaria sp. FL1042]